MRVTRRHFMSGAAGLAVAGTAPLGLSRPARAASGTIAVWKFGGTPREVEFWAKQNEVFLKANPDVKLEYSYFNGQMRRQKMQAALQTGQIPDVIVGFGQDVPELATFKAIQPLNDLAGDKLAGWQERIVPQILTNGNFDGKLYGLPVYVDMAPFLAYNIDALKEADFDGPPRTWSELRDYAKKLTKPDRPGFAFPATTAPGDINIFESVAYMNGGRVYDPATGKVTLDDRGVVDALQFYVDLVKDLSTPSAASMAETNFRDTAQLFAQGRVAMWIAFSWLNTPWGTPETLNWTGAPFPRPDKPSGGQAPVNALMDSSAILFISASTQNPEAALSYVDFWSQNEQLLMWDGDPEYSRIPAAKAAWDTPELAQKWPSWVEAYKGGTLFAGAEPIPRFVGVTQVETALGAAIQEAILERKSPEQALADAAAAAQQQIDLLK
ncbi:extracellular solute-binding protein [Chelativorans sp.]|uniref:ABC transporter substrate-binding protein n=1 Tax=Chelativorans sp. TaxID=2203393 RepID=UPI0028121656|nr:extracellular solute-binding protein [Chelativorans sp.]